MKTGPCCAIRRLISTLGIWGFLLAPPASAEEVDIRHLVQKNQSAIETTTILVKRLSDGRVWVSNPERARQRFSPASTSKIPHTLIALENGIADASTVFGWDGVLRPSRAWNQDQTLASAFRDSTVWVYQEIAGAAGQQVMSEGLLNLGYGNMNIGDKAQLTSYWLDDTLRISAREQTEFLSKLALETLPLSPSTYATAKDIMISDRMANWVIRSKTGWRHSKDSMDIGWFVGWVDCASEIYVFALNMDMPDTRSLAKRKSITYAILQDIGAFDCA